MAQVESKSYLSNGELRAIEDIYKQYLANPELVELGWRKFFEGFEFAQTDLSQLSLKQAPTQGFTAIGENSIQLQKEFNVINLINGYRMRGHLFTHTNPVRERRKYTPTLDVENFGLTKDDLQQTFQAGNEIGLGPAKLSDIVAHLQATYCRSVGAEFKYIPNPDVVKWFEERMERCRNEENFSIDVKRRILQKLNEAVAFENFLHTKFVGQKRFSLEGCETLIPALDVVVDYGADLGIKEFVIGMAHRGRLNVLSNILQKTREQIFTEFEGKEFELTGFDGDVKYHLGYSTDVETTNGHTVHLSLAPNPSHLEAVDPVVQGIVRSKIDNQNGKEDDIAAILIHGDAAIAAQGIVYEVIQMSMLDGYRTGGTIHLIVNNQIGFTTNYLDARSSTYCTDVAKVTKSPVFHVNGDDVEALVYTIKLAIEYRQKYHRDVFVDILGYRKYGHNEGDEPRFTQPLLYKAIAVHPNPREIYNQKLLQSGAVEASLAKEMEKEFKALLQQDLDKAKQNQKTKITEVLDGSWSGLRVATDSDLFQEPDTAVDLKSFNTIFEKITALSADKKFFNKITRLFDDRKQMLVNDKIDWAMGELMAYATLLNEGFPVRLSGQDVQRGTFSHRHAVVRVEDSEEEYIPLNNINPSQAKFSIYNSLLSEYGVLGFEYGYAFSSPNSLIIWEAQFGDFMNGAQIIIDQYLSSAEDKWRRMNGLVMLLPHGYEGQGAEHSSARLERWLSLCAENNMQIVNCTSPANFFHALRRQLKRNFRKPLVVLTPKSLLRHPQCVSVASDFTKGKFQALIDDADAKAANVEQVVFCSGKIYYDLLPSRNAHTAIVRIEQLYPFPQAAFNAVLKKYDKATRLVWVQEEPENMGACTFLMRQLRAYNIHYICRPESASPATGSHKAHENEQHDLVKSVFNF
ncbi:MAG: 2-oxoglutarate dehydrogenase E1 component [Bacteroidetes bacterium]|nr:2-oxoglutarate dehydrogenase E1 component [Bacteroidota bacterium]